MHTHSLSHSYTHTPITQRARAISQAHSVSQFHRAEVYPRHSTHATTSTPRNNNSQHITQSESDTILRDFAIDIDEVRRQLRLAEMRQAQAEEMLRTAAEQERQRRRVPWHSALACGRSQRSRRRIYVGRGKPFVYL